MGGRTRPIVRQAARRTRAEMDGDYCYQAWQAKRHASTQYGHHVDPLAARAQSKKNGSLLTMADSNNGQITSTSQAAYQFETVESFEAWLDTPQPVLDTKTRQPVLEADGQPKMRLPAAPGVSANISPEWMYQLFHHPVIREGRSPQEYQSGDASVMARRGVYIQVMEAAGRVKLPKDLLDGWAEWQRQYDAELEQSRSEARKSGAEAMRAANAEKTAAVGQLSALQQRIASMLAKGIIDQATADFMLSGEDS